MRIAFHAINGVGLGHLVRAVTLARTIRDLDPYAKLLVLTNALDPSIVDRAGLDYVQLPPRLNEPHADPKRAFTSLPEPLEEAALTAALDVFAPDVVVFDTHAPLRIARHATTIGARSVLVLRELRPDALRDFAKRAGAFDRIVVPHEAGELDLAPLADLPIALVGPVVREITTGAIAPSASPRVVAIAGGGGQPVDARRYLRAVADAHILARARVPDLETILVTGPYGEAPRGAPGLTILGAHDELEALLGTATLVVSQAGYNAVAEIRALGLPAILVPGYRKAEDQRARARRLVRANAAVIAKPEARSIADRIEMLLARPERLEAMRGAHRARPLVSQNRAAATAVLRPFWRPARRVEKVVLVAHDFAPKLGGMETVAGNLAKTLRERDVDVRVYTAKRLGARTDRVEPLYLPLPPPGRIDLEADLLLTIDAALRDAPDVIHLCNAGLAPWVPALRAALPSAVTVHVHGNDLLAPWVRHSFEDYAARQSAGLSAADAVVCVSRFSRRLAIDAGVPPERLHVIENGVDPRTFCPLERTHGEVILTVSRLAPRKGHRTVLRALARLAPKRPRLKYVYTGASDAMHAELAALAAELGIGDRVVATAFVPDAALPALYREADIFVLCADEAPTDVEGFGVALLEAAASGLPVVASRTGGIPEAVVDGTTGILVPPGDVVATAAALERLLDDRELAQTLGRNGRDRVVAELSHERATERTLALWNSLVERDRFAAHEGVEIVRHAQRYAAERRAARAARRETFANIAARGHQIRLRATGDGARLLPDALEDCAKLQKPRVEVKLRRFIEPDFAAHALPSVEGVELVHGIPHRGAESLLAKLRNLPEDALRLVRVVRLHCANEDPSAVPEAHALRRFFGARGITVVPPPSLMRYLSEQPALGPETAMIEPTNLCNLACPTCPTGTGKIPPLPPMTLARFERARGALGPRLRNLALWNYGEPLLNRDLPQMIAHAKKTGVAVVKVSSNVHFLDGDRGLALLQSGLDVLILSVDGASHETYATFRKEGDFARVSRTVEWLCAEKKRLGLANPRIELQFIVMHHNEHELPEMRRLARAWGVDRLRIKTVGADDPETKNLVPTDRLLSRYRGEAPNVRHPFCTMPWDHAVVNVDGSVTPCCYLRPDMGPAFVMGNVFETDFASIWRGEKYRAFRAEILDGRENLPVCNRCRGGTHDLLAAIEEVAG